jgi:hypothetical protein
MEVAVIGRAGRSAPYPLIVISLFRPMPSIRLATHDPRSAIATVSIEPDDLLRSLYVSGATGTGKSARLLNLLLGAAAAGFGVCVIDETSNSEP